MRCAVAAIGCGFSGRKCDHLIAYVNISISLRNSLFLNEYWRVPPVLGSTLMRGGVSGSGAFGPLPPPLRSSEFWPAATCPQALPATRRHARPYADDVGGGRGSPCASPVVLTFNLAYGSPVASLYAWSDANPTARRSERHYVLPSHACAYGLAQERHQPLNLIVDRSCRTPMCRALRKACSTPAGMPVHTT